MCSRYTIRTILRRPRHASMRCLNDTGKFVNLSGRSCFYTRMSMHLQPIILKTDAFYSKKWGNRLTSPVSCDTIQQNDERESTARALHTENRHHRLKVPSGKRAGRPLRSCGMRKLMPTFGARYSAKERRRVYLHGVRAQTRWNRGVFNTPPLMKFGGGVLFYRLPSTRR